MKDYIHRLWDKEMNYNKMYKDWKINNKILSLLLNKIEIDKIESMN